MKKIIFSLFILMLFIPKTLFAWPDVYGLIYNTSDRPLSGVKVSTKDDFEIYTTYSNDYGHYQLSLRNQKYTLKYEKDGYESQTKDIDLTNTEYYLELERLTIIATTVGTITGTWNGNYTIPDWGYSADFTLQLEQNGSNITGNVTTSDGCKGTLTGTINDSVVTFEVKGKKSGICCKSKWKGTAIITCSEDYMVMTFTIKDNCNGKTVGSGEFWKQ